MGPDQSMGPEGLATPDCPETGGWCTVGASTLTRDVPDDTIVVGVNKRPSINLGIPVRMSEAVVTIRYQWLYTHPSESSYRLVMAVSL